MIRRFLLFNLVFNILFPSFLLAQIKINEILSSNYSGIIDEDNENSDWIELFNNSDDIINLKGYKLSDEQSASPAWEFPSFEMLPKSYLLVLASGKDRKEISYRYKTLIDKGDIWKYSIITSSPPNGWRNTDFNDSSWEGGGSGFGYGDNDDNTQLNGVERLCIRKEFNIDNVNSVKEILLHMDYDDGFIAFINGKMVAAGGNISYSEDYSQVTIDGDTEAKMYQGGSPELFRIQPPYNFLRNGKNVLAIQGFNISSTSSDFSLIPILTIGSTDYSSNNISELINVGEKNLHTNFKISNEGEPIYLFNSENVIIDTIGAVFLTNDISYGRYPDGAEELFYFPIPTPGGTNKGQVSNYTIDSVYFSVAGGYYIGQISVGMSSKGTGGIIRYTSDGSVPNENSSRYIDPVYINKSTVLRAAYFKELNKNNPVSTCTYIFERNNGLPAFSISTDPYNLKDYNYGIYADGPNADPSDPHFGANYWMDWERPVGVEFFDDKGIAQLNQQAGVKISGNWSRARPQKSMALYARSKYGKGDFDYKFFHDRANDSFESINLRNSGNDWNYSFFRDGLVSEIAKGMNIDRLAYQPSVVYLNGEYWGILNLREKPTQHYLEENYGVDKSKVNILENNGDVIDGDASDYAKLRNFITARSISEKENYEYVSGKMDIDCFIDYQILEIYIHNGDWPGNNIKFWNTSNGYSKYRWIIFDTDFGFDLYHNSSYINSLEFATEENGPSWPNPPWSTMFLRKLIVNDEFKVRFINRFMDCLNTNLESENINNKVDSIASIIDLEMYNHTQKWGNTYYNSWLNEVEEIKNFNIDRNYTIREYIRSYFGLGSIVSLTINVNDKQGGKVKLNTITPAKYPFTGKYFKGIPVALTAIPEPGYKFVRWEGNSGSGSIKINQFLSGSEKYTAVFEKADEPEKMIVINEISYYSSEENKTGDWIEIYNAGSQSVDLNNWAIQDYNADNGFVFPQGKIIYPGEYLVVAQDSNSFNSNYPGLKNKYGNFLFGLNSGGDIIYLYDGEGNEIDKVLYGTTSPWPDSASVRGATLELVNCYEDNNNATNWQTGIYGGTPGRKNSVTSSVINNKLLPETEAYCYPSVFKEYTTLKFYSNNKSPYFVEIIDIGGKTVFSSSGKAEANEMVNLELFRDGKNFKNGFYLIRIVTDNRSDVVKVLKK